MMTIEERVKTLESRMNRVDKAIEDIPTHLRRILTELPEHMTIKAEPVQDDSWVDSMAESFMGVISGKKKT